MSTGNAVAAQSFSGDHVFPTVAQYSSSLDLQDSSLTLAPPVGTLVVDSQPSWITMVFSSVYRSLGGFERSYNPQTTSQGNLRTYSFFDIFYNRIHYDPAVMRMGQLLNAQTRDLLIWNAYFEVRTLETVIELNGEGVEMNYGVLPQQFLPLQQKKFTVSVDLDGPPSIDATYTFQWDNGTYEYHVTGERIVVFAFPPNVESTFTEQFKWYNTINEAYTGREQRMSLNENPKISYTYKIQVLDHELQMFDSVMWGWQNRLFAIPVWNSYTKTTQAVGVGTTTLFVESTADREFTTDRVALIYAGPELYESVEVLEVQADRLILKKPLARSWSAAVPVMPVRNMRLAREISYTGPVANFREVDISLISEAGEAVPAYTWPVTYKGLPVINFSPDMSGGIQGSYNRNMDWEDGEYSLPLVTDKSGVGTPRQVWQFTWDSYKDIQRFKGFLASLYGSSGEFWISTWAPDMTLAAPVVENASFIYVEAAQFANMYFDRRGRNNIVIQLKDGTQFYRQILSITTGSGLIPGSELFVLDDPIPRGISMVEIQCISWLARSRFENETFDFVWTTQDWASMNAMIKGLSNAV